MKWNSTSYSIDTYDEAAGAWLPVFENETLRDEAERKFGNLAAQGLSVRLVTVCVQYANPR
jgi:hypothetical protein